MKLIATTEVRNVVFEKVKLDFTLMNVRLNVVDGRDGGGAVEGNVAEAVNNHTVDKVHRLKLKSNFSLPIDEEIAAIRN